MFDKFLSKMARKAIFDQAFTILENERQKVPEPGVDNKYLDVLNSGIFVDLNRLRGKSIDLAIKALKLTREELERREKGN